MTLHILSIVEDQKVVASLGIDVAEAQLASTVRFAPGQGGGVVPATGGPFLAFDAENQPVRASGTGADSALRTDLAANGGAALSGFIPAGTGGVKRSVESKLRDTVSVKDFGAKGDGTTDDTAAIKAAIAAVPAGGTLHLGTGAFLVSQSFIFTKPIQLVGAAKERCYFVFAPSGTYVTTPAGNQVGMWFLHSSTVVSGFSGDSRRSVLSGFSLNGSNRLPANMIGCVISAPIYLYQVDAFNFGKDGFAVFASIAGDPDDAAGVPRGNANGTSFTNCQSISNGRNGFHLLGDNSNACFLLGCRAPANAGKGFKDDTLLGNAYVACEADNNAEEGYWTNPSKPSSSSFLSCYSETAPHFSVGPLTVMWGAQGLYKPARASGGVIFRGLPVGAAYCSQPIRIAATDDIANSTGDAPNAGPYLGLGDTGVDYRATATSLHVRLNGLLSANYTDLLSGADPVFRFPNSAVTGNLRPARAWAPTGISIGASGDSAFVGAGTAAPTTGTYAAGAIFLNQAPAAGGKIGWVCVTGGTPGVWKAWGAIDA